MKEGPEADVPEGEEGEGAPPKKKLSLRLVATIGAAALIVLGSGGGAAFFLLKPKPDAAHAAKPKKSKKKPGKEQKGGKDAPSPVREGPNGVLYYDLPNVVVNMQTADGRPTFLKLKLTLELPDQDAVDALEGAMPRLRDMFQTFLRELRPEDLAGSQGSYQLRMELMRRVNLVVTPSKANAVLIEEMLIN